MQFMKTRYNSYSKYIKENYNTRIQKISINAGFTCPNRDGTKGIGGCIYCNNITFSPYYCKPSKSITQQLNEGIAFFSKKYKAQKYFAYFQAYTNTYSDINKLKELYEEALSHPEVIGLIIATRPDCIDKKIINYLVELSKTKYISIEYGVETTNNKTLELINRCHTFEESVNAINLTSDAGLDVGVHMILGLPGENRDVIINHAKIISKLPIKTLKLHQLQIIKGTNIEKLFSDKPELFLNFSIEQYVDLIVDFLEVLNPKIIIERFTSESPINMIISPKWGGLKNFEITAKIEKRLKERDSCQGKINFNNNGLLC